MTTTNRKTDVSDKLLQDSARMGSKMHKIKSIQKTKTKVAPKKRPEPPDEVKEIYSELSEGIRENVMSLIEAEKNFDDPITLNQLGKMMGFSSAFIYGIMNGRNEIGIMTISRLSYALGCNPWLLMMPNDEFEKNIIPNYIRYRRGEIGSDQISMLRTARKSPARHR